jgi:hypothetical protein
VPVEQRTAGLEVQYMEDHYAELSAYRGEWLLIQDSELIVHSSDFSVIKRKIKERNITSPFLHYVSPDDETTPFIGA